jgi:hypothetical protein
LGARSQIWAGKSRNWGPQIVDLDLDLDLVECVAGHK